jgi:hypothetical protein
LTGQRHYVIVCEGMFMKAVWFLAIPLLGLAAEVASAQSAPSRVAVTYHEGIVYINGQQVSENDTNLSLGYNSVVRTGKGRAGVLFGHGDTVFLAENSSARVNPESAWLAQVEILTGSAVIITDGLGPAVTCVQHVNLSDAGTYRFDAHRNVDVDKDWCRLKVYKGAASVQEPSFVWVLTAGKVINLNRTCGDHTQRNEFNAADIDDFDRWSRQHADAAVRQH